MSSRVGGVLDWALAWSAALVALGCASLEAASSGQIGCAEQDIVITNDELGLGTRSWVASCHGKRFFCSAVGNNEVSCKEALDSDEPKRRQDGEGGEMVRRSEAPRPAPAPEPGGCQYDTQCKGDRVCDDGECISPRKKAVEPDDE